MFVTAISSDDRFRLYTFIEDLDRERFKNELPAGWRVVEGIV